MNFMKFNTHNHIIFNIKFISQHTSIFLLLKHDIHKKILLIRQPHIKKIQNLIQYNQWFIIFLELAFHTRHEHSGVKAVITAQLTR